MALNINDFYGSNIEGLFGPTGPTGPAGVDGIIGVDGATGPTGPEGPITDHNNLTNRSAADAHPISAITGLQLALDNLVVLDSAGGASNRVPYWDSVAGVFKIDRSLTLDASNNLTVGGVVAGTSAAFASVAAVGNPTYSLTNQSANSGKIWRFGHTGSIAGFNSWDVYNQTDNQAYLSLQNNTVTLPSPVSLVIGTDPGGSDLLRVGGGVTVGSLAANTGEIVTLDVNGTLVASGSVVADFATSAQGGLADSAVQSIASGTQISVTNVGTAFTVNHAAITTYTTWPAVGPGPLVVAGISLTNNGHVTDLSYARLGTMATKNSDLTFSGATVGYDLSLSMLDFSGGVVFVGTGLTIELGQVFSLGGVSITDIKTSADTVTSNDTDLVTAGYLATHVTSGGTWTTITNNINAVSGGKYFVDSTLGVVNVTLPSTPSIGDKVTIARISAANGVAIQPNGANFLGSVTSYTLDSLGDSVELVYSGATVGWTVEGQLNLSTGTVDSSSPVATVISVATADTPDIGWLVCNGSAISRTSYAALFSRLGTTYGTGDGSTTFNLPDLRGEFIRGFDDGRGIDSGRVFGSWQNDLFKAHTHSYTTPASYDDVVGGTGTSARIATTANTSSTGGAETRPRNIAMNFWIKY